MMKILQNLLNTRSMYDLALDIGISEYSLYCYKNNYAKISDKMKNKIETYLKSFS